MIVVLLLGVYVLYLRTTQTDMTKRDTSLNKSFLGFSSSTVFFNGEEKEEKSLT